MYMYRNDQLDVGKQHTLYIVCTHIKHDNGCYESQESNDPINLCAGYARLVQMKSAGTLSYSSESTWHPTLKLELLAMGSQLCG